MAQYGLPIADVALTSATQGAGDGDASAFDELDEGFGAGRGTGTGPDDLTTYWQSSAASTGPTIRTRASSVTDPASSSGHVVRSREKKSATGGKQLDAAIAIYGDDASITPIATTVITNFDTTTWTTHTLTLAAAEADAITDYGTINLETVLQWTGGGAGRTGQISAQEFECPDAGGGGGRTTKNTRAFPLGVEVGMNWRGYLAAVA